MWGGGMSDYQSYERMSMHIWAEDLTWKRLRDTCLREPYSTQHLPSVWTNSQPCQVRAGKMFLYQGWITINVFLDGLDPKLHISFHRVRLQNQPWWPIDLLLQASGYSCGQHQGLGNLPSVSLYDTLWQLKRGWWYPEKAHREQIICSTLDTYLRMSWIDFQMFWLLDVDRDSKD